MNDKIYFPDVYTIFNLSLLWQMLETPEELYDILIGNGYYKRRVSTKSKDLVDTKIKRCK